MELVGKAVRKSFPGFGIFSGVVESYDRATGYFRILYQDGDSEEVDLEEIAAILKQMGESSPLLADSQLRSKRGRRPKKRRVVEHNRPETSASGGNAGEEVTCLSAEQRDQLSNGLHNQSNGGFHGISDEFCGTSPSEPEVRGNDNHGGFALSSPSPGCKPIGDLAAGMKINANGISAGECDVTPPTYKAGLNFRENSSGCSLSQVKDGPLFDNTHLNSCLANGGPSQAPAVSDVEVQRVKKRPRMLDKALPSQVLRRSTRKASAPVQSLVDSVIPMDSTSAVSESQFDLIDDNVKPTLPPSSNNIDLGGLPVIDVFAVYIFLRSFSRTLFLSPFSLEAFVAALRCTIANSLTDSIHASILHTLKPHLEFLAQEGSSSAIDCLRNLNWELLDLVTWPLYLCEYLLLSGSSRRSNLNLSRMELLKTEYYKQPPGMKLEILLCLYNDVIESESVKSELSKRMLESGLDAENIVLDSEMKKRKCSNADSGISLSHESPDRVDDGNSDVCWLCGMEGNLICCDGCPAAFHSRCVGVATDLLPEAEWYCPECTVAKSDGLTKQQILFSGADILGVDPHARVYFGCVDLLLVCDDYDMDCSCHYYNRKDLIAVIDVLKSSNAYYASITREIANYYKINQDASSPKDHIGLEIKENIDTQDSLANCSPFLFSNLGCIINDVSDMTGQENLASPDHFDLIQSNSATIQKVSGSLLDLQGCCKGTFVKPGLIGDQENPVDFPVWGCSSSMSRMTRFNTQIQSDLRNYTNYYTFGRVASSVAHAFARNNNGVMRPFEDIKSAQLKMISGISSNFYWYDLKIPPELQNEKCGWCFLCKNLSVEDCMFKVKEREHMKSSHKHAVGLRSEKNKKSHLFSVVRHILWLEDQLRVFLSGPWEKPHYSKWWRKAVLKASDITDLKHSLLILESNLRRVVFSSEWGKPVDSVHTMGSSGHNLAISGLCWWRGGRLSRRMFHWKMLPKSLVSKCGRQAGFEKICGIFYPDGLDFAKRSKHLSWRAAVEMSECVAHLVYQVKDLHANIRWSELSITEHSSNFPKGSLSKKSKRSAAQFKKVIIRKKCFEGACVKYLLDFGKREIVPAVISKHGVKLEEPVTGRTKYWLSETYVPLYLVKVFEEKKLSRILKKENSMLSKKAVEYHRNRPQRSKGFASLFSRLENLEKKLCVECNEHVLIRDAVNCYFCNGLFHKKHFRVPKGTKETIYSCLRCEVKNNKQIKGGESKVDSEKLKNYKHKDAVDKLISEEQIFFRRQSVRTAKKRKRMQPVKVTKKEKSRFFRDAKEMHGHAIKLAKVKHRTYRMPKKLKAVTRMHRGQTNQKKNCIKGHTKGRITDKLEICINWPQMKRTILEHSYWLDGLKWTRKANDEQGSIFRERNIFLLSENTEVGNLRCYLCDGGGSPGTIFLRCEKCEDCFHGDAFCLTLEKLNYLAGFRCCKCLTRSIPVCPFRKKSVKVETCKNITDAEQLEGV